MAGGNYAEACPKLEESLRIDPALGTLLNLADCYERAGKLATAWSKYLELAAKARAAGQTERAQIGRRKAAALAPRLANLVIEAPAANRTPGLEVSRDGAVVGQSEWGAPIPIDSGTHTIDATAAGRSPWSASVDVAGDASTVKVVVPELAPVVTEPASSQKDSPSSALPTSDRAPGDEHGPRGLGPRGLGTQKILAIVSGSIGLAGVGIGTFFGLQSMSKHSTASAACPRAQCPDASGSDLWNDARTSGNISTVAFIVGGAGVAGGLALWLTAPKAERDGAGGLQVGMGPGSIQLRGGW